MARQLALTYPNQQDEAQAKAKLDDVHSGITRMGDI